MTRARRRGVVPARAVPGSARGPARPSSFRSSSFRLTEPQGAPLPCHAMERSAAPRSLASTPAAAGACPRTSVFAMSMSMPMCGSSLLSQEESGRAAGRRM